MKSKEQITKEIAGLKKERDQLTARIVTSNPDWRDVNSQIVTLERVLADDGDEGKKSAPSAPEAPQSRQARRKAERNGTVAPEVPEPATVEA